MVGTDGERAAGRRAGPAGLLGAVVPPTAHCAAGAGGRGGKELPLPAGRAGAGRRAGRAARLPASLPAAGGRPERRPLAASSPGRFACGSRRRARQGRLQAPALAPAPRGAASAGHGPLPWEELGKGPVQPQTPGGFLCGEGDTDAEVWQRCVHKW